MNNKLKPAIIGGVVVGLLSAIPFVNFLNICCCLWALLGGALASYLYIKGSPIPAKTGDGAVLGLLAGIVGAAIYIVIGIPIEFLLRGTTNEMVLRIFERINPAQVEMMRQMLAEQTVVGAIVKGLIVAVLLLIFSTVGGLLGVPIFEKRKGGELPPTAPQGFGGGQQGGGFAA
jgi:hypothetical protein